MKNKEELKFRFECRAKVLDKSVNPYFESIASLDHLKSLLPKDIDLNYNDDILPIVGNMCTPNFVNKNGHLVNSEGALIIAKNVKYKMVDIDHDRNQIVGVCASCDMYDFEGNKLSEEQALATKDPFYLSICALIYKEAVPGLVPHLQDSSDLATDDIVSFSWELKFYDYHILKGSKNIKDGELISDEGEVEKIKGNLKMFGGSGKLDDGSPIYMMATGDIIFSGVALTLSPAAAVENILVLEPEVDVDAAIIPAGEQNQENLLNSTQEEETKEEETKINSSQIENPPVTTNMSKILKIEKREDITDENLVNISASTMLNYIADEIGKASEDYIKQVKDKEAEIEAAKTASKDLADKVSSLESDNSTIRAELDELKTKAAAKDAEDLFNARMSSLDEVYELDNEKRSIIAKQIKSLNQDEYLSWSEDFGKLNKGLLKQKATVVKASVEVEEIDAAELLKQGKQETPAVIATQTTQPSLKDQFEQAFSIENIQFAKNRKNLK